MKYKLLLTGKHTSIINEFFVQMDDCFECLTSTTSYSDLLGHIKYFNPDAVVYCMSSESKDNVTSVINLNENMLKPDIKLILICNDDDLTFFRDQVASDSDLVLKRPILVPAIREKLIYFLDKNVPKDRTQTSAQGNRDLGGMAGDFADEADLLLSKELYGNSAGSAKSYIDTKLIDDLLPKKRIMIVDDSPVMLKTIKGHLGNDYEVATAISGKIALRYLQTKPVELILLDYEMPDENGPAVMEKILANPLTANIPIVFLTGTNDASKIQKALSLKPRGYLLKPIDKTTLLNKVHEILG